MTRPLAEAVAMDVVAIIVAVIVSVAVVMVVSGKSGKQKAPRFLRGACGGSQCVDYMRNRPAPLGERGVVVAVVAMQIVTMLMDM